MLRRFSSVVLLVATTLTACTSDLSSSPTDPTTPVTTAPETTTTTVSVVEAVEEFRLCLNENGAAVETIPFDAHDRPRLDLVFINLDLSDALLARALETCSPHLITGAISTIEAPVIGALVIETLTAFSECVRSQGVPDFPDPVTGFIGIGSPYPPDEIPYGNPRLGAAVDVCRARLGARAG